MIRVVLFLRLILFAIVLTNVSCSSWKRLTSRTGEIQRHDFVGDTIDGWALVHQNGLWGYTSERNKYTIAPTLLWADDFSEGMALVLQEPGYSFINKQGQKHKKLRAPMAYSFSEGLAAVQRSDGKWGYIDTKGQWVIWPQFSWAHPFKNNRARVSFGLWQGYIDRGGQTVIPPRYDAASDFVAGAAIVQSRDKYGLIDTLGELRTPLQFKKITAWEQGLYLLEAPEKRFGLANAHGDMVIEAHYWELSLVDDRYIRAKRDSLVGCYNLDGSIAIPLEYGFLGYVSPEGYIAAQKDGKWGFVDTAGKTVLPFDYEECRMGFREGKTWVKKEGKHIVMDDKFNIIATTDYDYAYSFNNGYAIVGYEGETSYDMSQSGYVNSMGREVITPQYHSAWSFNRYGITIAGIRDRGISRRFLLDSTGAVLPSEQTYYDLSYFGSRLIYNQSGNTFTFIDPATGRQAADFPYSALHPVRYGDRNDLATVTRDGKKGVIDTLLTELIPPVLDDASTAINGRMAIKRDGLWGFADEQFRPRIPYAYDQASSFRYDLAEIEKDGAKGAIDRMGRIVIPLTYTNITLDYLSNRVYAEKAHGYDIYDMEGRLLLETDYDYLGGYWGTSYTTFRKGDMLGALDYHLAMLCDPQYDRIGPFYNGRAWVVKDGKIGFVNQQFDVVIPLEYENAENYALGFTRVSKSGRTYYINPHGEEITPDEQAIENREAELKRRQDNARIIEFSS